MCTKGSLCDVKFAIVWRVLEEYEVGVGVRLEPLEAGLQHTAATPLSLPHFLSIVKLFLQNLSNL